MYLFLSELCKGIDPFSPPLLSFEWLNGKGFFYFSTALMKSLLGMGEVFSLQLALPSLPLGWQVSSGKNQAEQISLVVY